MGTFRFLSGVFLLLLLILLPAFIVAPADVAVGSPTGDDYMLLRIWSIGVGPR